MSVPRLVIFDVDGTLVDSQRHIVEAMDSAFAAVGLPSPPVPATLGIVGLSLPVAMARLAPDLDPAGHDALVAGYKASFHRLAARAGELSALYPGARAALDALAAEPDVTLAIATGKSRRGLDAMLALHGLEGLFASVQVADDHPSKPHPSMVLAALDETGHAPGQAVMIGDTGYDMEMACAAGVVGLGVTWGYQSATALREAGAARLVDDFAALMPALDLLWGRA